MTAWLARVGLDRPELRAWAMYDWAISAFWCTVILAVFPPFFADYAAAGLPPTVATARFAWATTIAVTIVAVMGPILGAIADYRAMKKRLLAAIDGPWRRGHAAHGHDRPAASGSTRPRSS